MKLTKLFFPLACSVSALQLVVPPAHADELRIEPIVSVRHSDDSANAMYQLGRHHQQGNRLDDAADAYRAALKKDPGHLEARNALATIYIAQNDMPAAVAEFRTALQMQPGLSHIHSNLGYAYLLEDKYPAALSELAQAVMIDSANTRALGNLALAYEKLGAMLKERKANAAATTGASPAVSVATAATTMPATTSTSATSTTSTTSTSTASTTTTIAASPMPVDQAMLADTEDFAEAPSIATNDLAIESTVMAGAAGTRPVVEDGTQAEVTAAAATYTGINIEIANGTPEPMTASRIADALRSNGVNIDRVSGLMPYKQQRTVILYRDGYRKAALELSKMFAVPPAIVNNTHTRNADDRSTVRLVLGKTAAKAEIQAAVKHIVASR